MGSTIEELVECYGVGYIAIEYSLYRGLRKKTGASRLVINGKWKKFFVKCLL